MENGGQDTTAYGALKNIRKYWKIWKCKRFHKKYGKSIINFIDFLLKTI